MKQHITYRVSVKYGAGWFMVYEGTDKREIGKAKDKYKDRRVGVERI